MSMIETLKEAPSWKNKHFEILNRIQAACSEAGIKLFLCDETALVAYRDSELSDDVIVAIDVRDAHKFINTMEKEKDLRLRGMFNFHRYTSFDIKVYDPNTTDFNLATERIYGFDCLYVTVKFIHHLPDLKITANFWKKIKREYRKYVSVNYIKEGPKKGKKATVYKTASRLMDKRNVGEHVFNRLVNIYSRNSKYLGLGREKYYNGFFDEGLSVNIQGREFMVPGDAEAYFEMRFGKNWKSKEIKKYEETNSWFRDTEHLPEEFRKRIEYLDFDTFYYNIKRIKSYRSRFNKMDKKFNKTKYLLERTHLRFVFWQKYMPIKDQLIALHRQENYEVLEELMEDYIKELDIFGARSLTIYFDREIFDIAKDIFIYNGRPEMADYIETKIPEEHLEPIRIKNYKGEFI